MVRRLPRDWEIALRFQHAQVGTLVAALPGVVWGQCWDWLARCPYTVKR